MNERRGRRGDESIGGGRGSRRDGAEAGEVEEAEMEGMGFE